MLSNRALVSRCNCAIVRIKPIPLAISLPLTLAFLVNAPSIHLSLMPSPTSLGKPSNLIFGQIWDFVPTEGPSVRGGVDLVGTKSQIFPKIRFEGSPKATKCYVKFCTRIYFLAPSVTRVLYGAQPLQYQLPAHYSRDL